MWLLKSFPTLYISGKLREKNYFPIKQYRIWNYTSPRSFHTRKVETK